MKRQQIRTIETIAQPRDTAQGYQEPFDLFNMVGHQNERFVTIGGVTWEVLRVPRGWIYSSIITNEMNISHVQTSIFIPEL